MIQAVCVDQKTRKGGAALLKQKVIIKDTEGDMYGMEGIIVAVNAVLDEKSQDYEKNSIVCKVLVGDVISDWLPHSCLELINQTFAKPA